MARRAPDLGVFTAKPEEVQRSIRADEQTSTPPQKPVSFERVMVLLRPDQREWLRAMAYALGTGHSMAEVVRLAVDELHAKDLGADELRQRLRERSA